MSSGDPCPVPAVLERWLVGRAGAEETDAIERHLGSCPRCSESLRTLTPPDGLAAALRPPLARADFPYLDRAEALIPALKALRSHDPTGDWDGRSLSGETREFDPSKSPFAALGDRVGPYQLLGPIGAGGMGVVFRAEDAVLRRRVALKLIQPKRVRSASARERFLREAQALAALEHDNIVTVYQAGEADGVLFLAMPLLRGRTLQEALDASPDPVPADELLRVGRGIAAGLSAAHAKGIVHRDIKPANVWLEDGTDPPRVKILDFGLAQALTGAPDDEPGAVMGTPAYMAPEQALGQPIDGRADLFSLGCVLYRMATARQPFTGENFVKLMVSVSLHEPPPVRDLNPALPADLAALVTRLLRKVPADRPASADEVVAEIGRIEESRRPRVSRRKWLAWGAAAALAAAAGGAFVAREYPRPEPPSPGEVTFAFDEPDARVAIRLGDGAERVIDVRAEPTLTLPPGEYTLRAPAATDSLRLWVDRVDVPAGGKVAIALQMVGMIAGHKQHSPHAASSLVCREDGDKLAVVSVGLDRTVVAWNPGAEGRPLQVLGPAAPLLCAALSPDGKTLAVGLGNVGPKAVQAVRFRDPVTLQALKGDYPAKPGGVLTAIAYSADGKWLFAAQSDGTLSQWDTKLGIVEAEVERRQGGIHALAVSPDGEHVFSAGADGTVSEWSAKDLSPVRTYRGGEKPLRAVVTLPGGKQMAAVGDDKQVRVWDRATGESAASWKAPSPLRALAVSPDGSRLATGDDGGCIRMWDVAARKELVRFDAHASGVTCLAYTRDGRRVVSAGADGAVRVWSVPK